MRLIKMIEDSACKREDDSNNEGLSAAARERLELSLRSTPTDHSFVLSGVDVVYGEEGSPLVFAEGIDLLANGCP
jgi:hypothetical protein